MKKKKTYGNGTGREGVVRNYIESPHQAILENQLAWDAAEAEALSNPYTQAMGIIGTTAVNTGMNIAGSGRTFQKKSKAKYGKSNVKVPIEVEGEEVVETPQGSVTEVKGPKHEQGGVDISVPSGTDIYSDRIKVDDKTMAERKKARAKKKMSLEKLLEKNPTDTLTKNSLKRFQETSDMEDLKDQKIQEAISAIMGGQSDNTEKQEFKFGSKEGGIDFSSSITGGDVLGIAGNLYSTFKGIQNTKENRAGDKPNENFFLDYGQETLNTIDESKGLLDEQQANAKLDLELSRRSNIARGRNSARGVNTMRALDLASSAQADGQERKINSDFSSKMMQLLAQEGQTELSIDQVVMGAEAQRDIADRQDRDSYYSQLAEDYMSIGQGLQETGKDVNQIKKNDMMSNLINQLSEYGLELDGNGKIVNGKSAITEGGKVAEGDNTGIPDGKGGIISQEDFYQILQQAATLKYK